MKSLLIILDEHIQKMSREDINMAYQQLLAFFLSALDFRITQRKVRNIFLFCIVPFLQHLRISYTFKFFGCARIYVGWCNVCIYGYGKTLVFGDTVLTKVLSGSCSF